MLSDISKFEMETERQNRCGVPNDTAVTGIWKEHQYSTDLSLNEEENVEIKGKCKSGRFWKTPKTRFKTIVKTKGLQSSLERRMKIQEEIRKVKQLTRDNLNERKKQREEHRLRRKDNLKKREENQRKAEVVQVIKNPSKIKKKHLRMIEKRDTLPFCK